MNAVESTDWRRRWGRSWGSWGRTHGRCCRGLRCGGYQLEAAGPSSDSIRNGRGRQFALVFARQSGKDELIAQLVAYLLTIYQRAGGGIVLGSPTLRPQSEISRRRAMARLNNPLTAGSRWSRDGQVVGVGRAEAYYLSAAPTANARWDAVFDPMAASTNATTVFAGTVWSDTTLLARQMRLCWLIYCGYVPGWR